MDQMLDMLSSTQQIVLRQQDTCNREKNMAKLGSEVVALTLSGRENFACGRRVGVASAKSRVGSEVLCTSGH